MGEIEMVLRKFKNSDVMRKSNYKQSVVKPAKRILRKLKALDRMTDKLYRTISEYVKLRGGDIIVIGGIEIQKWPGRPKFNFTFA